VATLRLASISKDQSIKDARTLSNTSCVEAARQYVIGRLRVFGLDPTTITLDQAITVESGTRTLRTAHVNTANHYAPGPVVTSVQALPAQLVGNSGAKNRDMSNIIGMSRESTNKQLRAWEEIKWVRLERGGVAVLDHMALAKVASEGLEPILS